MQTQLRENLCLVILGKTGSGKSLLARAIVAHYALNNWRDHIVVITAKPDWSAEAAPVQGENYEIDMGKLGFVTFAIDRQSFADLKREDLDGAIREALSQPRVIIFDKGLDPASRKELLDHIGAYILNIGRALVVVDEAERYFPRSGASEPFLDLLRQGRYKGIDLIIITHTDTGVHPEVTQEANAILSFAIQHPTRIERLRYYFDDPRILATLERFEYLIADDTIPDIIRGYSTRDLRELKATAPEIFAA